MDDFTARLDSPDADTREAAFIELGDLALNDPKALTALIEYAEKGTTDPDEWVRVAAGNALGQQSNEPRCVPFLLRLLDDTDPEIREVAASGLPIVLDDPAPDHPAVLALIDRLADPVPGVRDWAAFALGLQLDVDSPALRTALRGLLSEPDTDDTYPAAEAAFGLARRGDPEVGAVIAERLGHPDHLGKLWLEAAGELADPALLPALLRLRAPDNEPDDPWVLALEEAINRCTRG